MDERQCWDNKQCWNDKDRDQRSEGGGQRLEDERRKNLADELLRELRDLGIELATPLKYASLLIGMNLTGQADTHGLTRTR